MNTDGRCTGGRQTAEKGSRRSLRTEGTDVSRTDHPPKLHASTPQPCASPPSAATHNSQLQTTPKALVSRYLRQHSQLTTHNSQLPARPAPLSLLPACWPVAGGCPYRRKRAQLAADRP